MGVLFSLKYNYMKWLSVSYNLQFEEIVVNDFTKAIFCLIKTEKKFKIFNLLFLITTIYLSTFNPSSSTNNYRSSIFCPRYAKKNECNNYFNPPPLFYIMIAWNHLVIIRHFTQFVTNNTFINFAKDLKNNDSRFW